jgi:hypothetical protein
MCYGLPQMARKRVFKTKAFGRWARKRLPETILCDAAREIEQGRFEADLGGGVCKKRIALPGKGKSGSTRTLVAHQLRTATVFIVGRDKSQPGGDFSVQDEEAARAIASAVRATEPGKFEPLLSEGFLLEICHGKEDH